MNVPETDVASVPAAPTDGVVVLDVRENDEWAAGHIEHAVHVPMGEVATRLAEVPPADEVLVICRAGSRSARVTQFLRQQGVAATNVAGGMQTWEAAGRPMVSDTGAPPQVI